MLKVKRSANGIITDPVSLPPDAPVSEAQRLMTEQNISGVPITDSGLNNGTVVGILTRRDMKFLPDLDQPISQVMTKDRLIIASPDTNLQQAEKILNQAKVEKLLLVNGQGRLVGLITMRDIDKLVQFPNACRDNRGRLRVGAAVGVNQIDRVEALIEAEVDVLVVDSAHGHSKNVIETVKAIKDRFDIDVIAGNVATEAGAKDLIAAGADAIKVGLGPGSICTTRIISGVGVPQVSAVINACKAARAAGGDGCNDSEGDHSEGAVESGASGVPVIADGGIRHSGDIAKIIAAGASCVMIGSLFAGLDESPGETVIPHGPTV